MNNEIKAGSVVQLKSGGPKMTVAETGEYGYDGYQSAKCHWFIQDKAPWKKEEAYFPLTSLKEIE
ncbi:DUF2158 domain-containing protein [Agrobacterium rhizogenes]|nr:DUF2158 domain-containing protein [Rhizobium rhizogenes]NTJ79074.1 DUF2158 domain-containing protein [Rhizobium rhizogenes]